MGLFSRVSVAALLERERALLDEIFGAGAYRIEPSRPEHAAVHCAILDVHFGFERDGEIGALIKLRDPPDGTPGDAEAWLWAKFLGVESEPKARDRHGRVRAAPEDQLRSELETLGRLMREVFSKPRTLREAACRVEGYTKAYNDRASGG